jgi:glycine/D-amino acid oxidase-like deaminating enzyme/nitrite reductase/ring-hydroxylating ferredoxin subunit
MRRDADCDVCVIGAGIAGLSAAYCLSRDGRRVIVLDACDIGGGQTAQTSAHLASALDDRFSELERVHGRDGSRLAYESHARAIDEIEATVARESIDCDFARVDGYLFSEAGEDAGLLQKELAAAQRAGFSGVAQVARGPLASFDLGPCLLFPRQARFHPLRYLAGIAAAVERRGGLIHTQTRAIEVRGGKRAKVVTNDGYEVRSGSVIVATNSPFYVRFAIHVKQAPYRTYVVVLRAPKGSIPDALYWDTGDPYHYVRVQAASPEFDHVLIGGEDDRTAAHENADDRYERLEKWARVRFPVAGDVVRRWSGQILEPFDHLAFIGKDPTGAENVYIATGDSGHGLTHGALGGILLADLVAGRSNPWQALYDPSRKSVRAAGAYAHGGLDVAKEYAQWLIPERRRGDATPAVGEGTVVQRGPRKVALYRDEKGTLHARSAVCPHLGDVVRWNNDAKSWDCGCHGSRFAPTGEVLNGPSSEDLSRVEPTNAKRSDLPRSILRGAMGGAIATVAMSVALGVQKALGMTGQLPPKKIARGLRRRAGVFGVPRAADNAMAIAAHLGFGISAGALFGLMHRRARGLPAGSLLGSAYGVAVWAASYYGWVPALGLMRAPHRDRSGRPASMVAAHVVFGSVLGAFVDRTAPHRILR